VDNKCPVCGFDIPKPKQHKYKNDYITEYVCTRCGDFNVFGGYSHFLPAFLGMDDKKIAILSHWIRSKHEARSLEDSGSHEIPVLDKQLVESILKQKLPTHAEQADNLIRWIGDNINSGNRYIAVNKYKVPAIVGSTTLDEFYLVFQHLKDTKRFIKHKTAIGRGNTDLFDVTLSFSGWEYYRKLKQEINKQAKIVNGHFDVMKLPKKSQEVASHIPPTESIRNNKLSKGKLMTISRTLWKQPSSQDIWIDIYEDFEVKKLIFAKKINFVKDKYKRKALFRDIEHAYILAKNGFSKPAVILAGSVIEELLRLYLIAKNVKAANNTFDEYIKACEQNGLLKGAISRLSDSVRHFRNLVHLKGEMTVRYKISKATATSAVASIFIISNDFQKNL